MSECVGNDYDGRMGTRISAIFVILVGSFLGTWFPVFAARHKGVGVPSWAFFIAKYFGSGVILATAFIHLLAPANEALSNPCLTGPITDYSWVEGIALMTVFVLFFVELMTMRYARFGHEHDHDVEHGDGHGHAGTSSPSYSDEPVALKSAADTSLDVPLEDTSKAAGCKDSSCAGPHMPGDDHLSHAREHPVNANNAQVSAHTHGDSRKTFDPESYSAQLTAVFILEFGVIFHSIFIGLTLAVAGEEFATLYVVLVFHQTFEGLALGSRLASIEWPKTKRWTPYILGCGYAISTPIAIAIGLGVRESFSPGSQTTLIANGVFDSISAGILIYTALVELMAHEFMFSGYMQRAPIKVVLAAVGTMALGAALMALLGKWA
ncbi:low-affinity Zn(2+) transporter zrt2 [Oleoguttula sp. CCFEE 5521]